MSQRIQTGVRPALASVLALLLCAATIRAQSGNQPDQPGGKSDPAQGQRMEGQAGMKVGQAGTPGMT
ncbi:MAG: hypothetical protein L0Z62_28035 [Gemmataceae bacterium]|nr:hypothetical protein [Gemmataceae bacterium]